MRLFKFDQEIPFMSLRMPAMILSGLLIIASVVSLTVNQLNWGLDFTGGTVIEVGYEGSADLSQIRNQMQLAGFGDAVVQNFGSSSDVLIRLALARVLKHRLWAIR